MDKFKDKILQYIISGKAAKDSAVDMEISDDPSFDKSDFELLNKIWQEADNLKDYQRVDRADAWSSIVAQTGIEAKVKPIKRNRQWMLAASIVGLLGLGLYFYLTADPYITHQALANENYTLPDNSTIDLQEGTEIRYLKPDKFAQAPIREIFLDGEGVFDVVSSDKPFKVVTPLTSVDVLGTQFKYRVEGNFSESENLEGQVKFATNDGVNEAILNPGDKASFDGTSMAVERYTPPPPPPPVIPTNNVTISDLLDILTERYLERIIWGASLNPSSVVVKVNLSETNLDSMMNNLQQDSLIQIEFSKRGNYYNVPALSGTPSGLTADYNYFQFISGVKPNGE